MPNLKTIFVQITDQKKSEIVQKAQIDFSINSSTKRSEI